MTIKGITADIEFFSTAAGTESDFHLYEDITFDSLTIEKMNHLYGNGHNITIGDNVSCMWIVFVRSIKRWYSDSKAGYHSGPQRQYCRIIGYIRSNGSVDANNNEAVSLWTELQKLTPL